jgi:hypothetical protein
MPNDQSNNANKPLSQYGQPVTFEQVWKMFHETNKQFQETDRKFQETDEKIDKSRLEHEKMIREMKEESRATTQKIDKLAKLYGGMSENSRDVAEEFFIRALETRDSIFGIKYEDVDYHKARKRKKLQGEYDIVLHNGRYVIVIEVKYKLHINDVKYFIEQKLPHFKILFMNIKI